VRSFTLAEGLHYAAIVYYLKIGLSVAIGGLAFRPRDRAIAAFVVGYCAPAIGTVALYAAFFAFPGSRLGPAYSLLEVAAALEIVAVIVAVTAIVTRGADRARPRVQSVRLGVVAALLLAVTATMNLTRVRGMSLWSVGLVPSRTAPAVVVELLVLALVPLLAIRLGGRTASLVVLGLALVTALSVADAALSRISLRVGFELTIGFWLTAVASVVLFLLVGSLRHDDRTTRVAPLPTAIG
jgi:hypothetical protein